MFKKFAKESWLEPRLIWDSPEGPKGPGTSEKPKEAIDAANEKLDAKKIDEIAERVKTLSLKEAKIQIGDGKKAPDAIALKQALAKALDPEKNPEMKTLNVKNLDVFLMNGLLENLGKADTVPSKVGPGENAALNKWMTEKGVAQFTIKEGYWYFFDKKGDPIKDDYKLDDTDAKDDAKPEEKVGGAKVEKAVLGAKVKEAQTRSKEETKKKETEAKAEDARLKPEKLQEASSDKPVPLKEKMMIGDLTKPLELSVTVDGKAAITSAELQKALLIYVNEAGVTGKDDVEKFANFLKQMMAKGYTDVSIKAGKFVFEGGGKSTSNPLDLSKIGTDNKKVSREAWAHEKLQTHAEQQKADVEKKEAAAKAPKETPFDKTEQEVAKLLTGKEKIEEKDLANVDKRYLPALQQILAYTYNGDPVKVAIPFNDAPLDAQFYRAVNGTYILKWGPGKQFYEYNPKDKTPAGLKEAQQHFAKVMNGGEMLRQIQSFNIEAKGNFEAWGMKIDEGPKKLAPGKVQYEFDWDTGALGDDPDVTIQALPHGGLAVTVEQNSVSLDGKKDYSFVAGGFQDMIRILKSLQKYVEAPDSEKAKMKADEQERRFFEQGPAELQKALGGVDAGKILNVFSLREGKGKDVLSSLDAGFRLEMDWMQKLVPPQSLTIDWSVNKYVLKLQPSNQILGNADKPLSQNFSKAMEIVAKQKQVMTLKEGESNLQKDVQTLIDDYNKLGEQPGYKGSPYPKIEMAGGVKVVSMSEGIAYLSRGEGMAPKAFVLGKMENGKLVPNPKGIEDAVKEGYFLNKPDSGTEGAKKEAPPKPVEVKVTSENKEMNPDTSVDFKERKDAVKNVTDKLTTHAKTRVEPYIWSRLVLEKAPEGDAAAKTKFYEKEVWKSLAKLAESKQVEPDENEKKEITKKLSLKATLDKFDSANAERFASVPELKNMPRVMMWLKGALTTANFIDYSIADPNAFEKELAEYQKKVLEQVAAYVKANPKKPNITQDSYDKASLIALDDLIKSPKTYLNEKYKQDQAKKEYEKYQEGLPLAEREAPPKPELKINIENTGNTNDNIPQLNEKVAAVDDALKPLVGTVNYQIYRKCVLGAMAAEVSPATETAQAKKFFIESAWKKLANLAGESIPAGKTFEDKDFQTKVIDKLKVKEISTVMTTKLNEVPEKDGVLKNLPKSQSYIAGLLDSLNSLDFKAAGVNEAADIEAAKKAYLADMQSEIKKVLTDSSMKKKPGETSEGYDQRVVQRLANLVKQPGIYMKEYGNYLAEKKKYDQYTDAKGDAAKKQKEYEEGKTNPHLMKFSEFKDKTMAGLGPDAYQMMAKTKGLNLDDVFLARVEGNSPTSDKMVSFNAKSGTAPNQVPVTINFYRDKGTLMIAVAEGWNNTSTKEHAGATGPDPVKIMVEHVVSQWKWTRLNIPVVEEKKPVPDAVAKKEGAPNAPSAPKVPEPPKKPELPKKPDAPKDPPKKTA